MASEKVNIVIKAVDKTKGTFRAVTAGLKVVKKAVFSLKTGLLALGGAAGFGYIVKQSMNTIDALGKVASKIGISTDALGGLRYAAEQTGVASNTLDMALQRMVRRVSEAALGTGEAVKALKELNIDAKVLSTLAPDQQFRAIADAMQGVTNQSDRVRLAMRLFDSEGVSLVNTLKGGSEQLKAFQDRAEKLGMTLTDDLVDGVERANDSILTFRGFLGGMFRRTVAELAPAIEALTENMMAFVEMKVEQGGGAGNVAKQMAKSIVQSTVIIVQSFESIANGFISIGNTAGKVSNIINELFGNVDADEAVKQIDFLQKKIDLLNGKLSSDSGYSDLTIGYAVAPSQEELNDLQAKLDQGKTYKPFEEIKNVSFANTISALDDVLARLKNINAERSNNQKPEQNNNEYSGISESLNALMQEANFLDTDTESLDALMVEANDIYKSGYTKMLSEQNQYESRYEAQQKEHYRKLIQQTHTYLARDAAMQKIARQENIQTLEESGREVISTLSGTYSWAFKMHKAFAIKDALIDTYKAVSTALSAAPPPKNYGLAAVALAKGVATVQNLRATQYREKGGHVTKGQPYIVGERGAELIIPNQASTVVPNDQLTSPVNVNFNITANDTRGFDQLLQQRRGQIVGMVNQALNDRGMRAIA